MASNLPYQVIPRDGEVAFDSLWPGINISTSTCLTFNPLRHRPSSTSTLHTLYFSLSHSTLSNTTTMSDPVLLSDVKLRKGLSNPTYIQAWSLRSPCYYIRKNEQRIIRSAKFRSLRYRFLCGLASGVVISGIWVRLYRPSPSLCRYSRDTVTACPVVLHDIYPV